VVKKLVSFLYILLDFLFTGGTWIAFVLYRRLIIDGRAFIEIYEWQRQLINAAVIGTYWVIVYALAGLYSDPYRRSRLRELTQVLKFSFLGVFVIFFLIFLDDQAPNYLFFRMTFTFYFLLQFLCITVMRLFFSTIIALRIRKRKIGYPTLLIGSGKVALQIFEDLNNRKRSLGYYFKGYLNIKDLNYNHLFGKIKHLGTTERLEEVIKNRKIEEVIIALEQEESSHIGEIVDICEKNNVFIKVVPNVYDYLLGSVKSSHIMGAPLIEVSPNILSNWESAVKRVFDLGFSITALLCLAPVYATVALAVKLNSPGPIFYRQERVGRNGEPFMIVKFRSMYIDAEKFGPALSKDKDPRITPVGRILRKTRLDELPQFWNVLKGEMSIVGPRPERQFFIDKIVKVAPHYRHLHKVRPGVTSWGQVKYGYAENVEEMVERLKYDILYIENISLLLDIKIILYTVIVMIEGRGK
jgi:exopolysaccharide biosynthesis polyprenyl glycosylphosphotransferase